MIKPGKIGLWVAIALILANTIGIGIFTTTGYLARDIGDPLLILALWVVGGLMALSGALCYGQLAIRWSESGGEYLYIAKAYGPCWGFLSGWTSFVMGFGAPLAAGAVGFSQYFLAALQHNPGDTSDAWISVISQPTFIALLLIWFLSYFHMKNINTSKTFQVLLTSLKLFFIAALFSSAMYVGVSQSSISLQSVVSSSADTSALSFAAVCTGLIFIFYAYTGWNSASYIASEIDQPQKKLPLALLLGTLIIIVIYLFINVVYFIALPVETLAADPILPFAEKSLSALLGRDMGGFFAAILCVSIASSLSALVWVGPRVYKKMADDGLAPAVFAGVNAAGVPVNAILIQSLWATLLVLSGSFEQLIIFSGAPLMLFSAIAVSSVVFSEYKGEKKQGFFFSRRLTIIAVFYLMSSAVILLYLLISNPAEIALSAVAVLSGLLFYWQQRDRADTGNKSGG